MQLVCVGILGEYIGRMYAHMQGRPTYFIAYDSLTTGRGEHGPTDTPLPASPAEGRIRTSGTTPEPATRPAEPVTETVPHPVGETVTPAVTTPLTKEQRTRVSTPGR